MALDVKKIREKAASFKKAMEGAETRIKELSKVHAGVQKAIGGAEGEAERILAAISEGKAQLEGSIASLKNSVDQARAVKGDIETILRREAEAFEFLQEMQSNWEKATEAAKKNKADKDLAKKAELAAKAFGKQQVIYGKVGQEALAVDLALGDLVTWADARLKADMEVARKTTDAIKRLKSIGVDDFIRAT